MKKKLLILALSFSLAINIGMLITIGFHYLKENMMARRPPQMSFLGKRLGLSNTRLKELELLRNSFLSNMDKLNKELGKERIELFTLVKEPGTDRKVIDRKLQRINFLQGELQRAIINNLLQMKALLTPEQQKKFFSIISQRIHGYWEGKRQNMGSPPPLMEENKKGTEPAK